MQIVIEIDENVFTRLFDNGVEDNEIAVNDVCEMAKAIRGGTPLPKGHGDLIDRDFVRDVFIDAEMRKDYEYLGLDDVPTIIEADVPDTDVGKMAESEDKE